MNLKKWFYLFWTTLLIGVGAAVVTIFVVQLIDPQLHWNDLSVFAFAILAGATYSVLSQMGFFAYLTVNYIFGGMFSRPFIWQTIQWIFIVVTFIDLIVLRQMFFLDAKGWAAYAIFPIVLLLVALITGKLKSNMTNRSGFTPTVFFIFTVTALEAIPALQQNNIHSTINMIIPLLACNIWQILILHRLVGTKAKKPAK